MSETQFIFKSKDTSSNGITNFSIPFNHELSIIDVYTILSFKFQKHPFSFRVSNCKDCIQPENIISSNGVFKDKIWFWIEEYSPSNPSISFFVPTNNMFVPNFQIENIQQSEIEFRHKLGIKKDQIILFSRSPNGTYDKTLKDILSSAEFHVWFINQDTNSVMETEAIFEYVLFSKTLKANKEEHNVDYVYKKEKVSKVKSTYEKRPNHVNWKDLFNTFGFENDLPNVKYSQTEFQ